MHRQDRHATRLPQAAWPELLARKAIYLIETGKRDGNVNLAELAILAQAAAATRPGTIIVEIGTFDGRTTTLEEGLSRLQAPDHLTDQAAGDSVGLDQDKAAFRHGAGA